jgi:hypothetical protein
MLGQLLRDTFNRNRAQAAYQRFGHEPALQHDSTGRQAMPNSLIDRHASSFLRWAKAISRRYTDANISLSSLVKRLFHSFRWATREHGFPLLSRVLGPSSPFHFGFQPEPRRALATPTTDDPPSFAVIAGGRVAAFRRCSIPLLRDAYHPYSYRLSPIR